MAVRSGLSGRRGFPGKERFWIRKQYEKNSIDLIAKAAYNVIWMLFLFIGQSKIMYIF